MEFFLFWFILSVIAGFLAKSKNRTAFGWFLLSLLVSPIITLIILAILQPINYATPFGTPIARGLEGQLRDLEALRDKGVLTQEEYDAKRKQIIGIS